MKYLYVLMTLCLFAPTVFSDHALYLIPINIEGEEYPSNVFMSIKERKISEGKPKYKMSRTVRVFDKASNASEAFASELIDIVYKEDRSRYLNMNIKKSISGKEKTISKSMNGFGVIKQLLSYSDSVYFTNEYDMLGLKFYETAIVPSEKGKAQGIISDQDHFFLLPMEETESGIVHRFDALYDPLAQCLVSARVYARKKDVKKNLKGLTKISYKPKFEGTKSTSERVDLYLNIIQPVGDTLFFKDGELSKTDFDKETNDIWGFYAEFWHDLASVPDVNDFPATEEYERYLGQFSKDSASRFKFTIVEGRIIKNYKFRKLKRRSILCAIDADPVYYVFYSTLRNPKSLGHETFLRDSDGYKKVNNGYLCDLELLWGSSDFQSELIKKFHNK